MILKETRAGGGIKGFCSKGKFPCRPQMFDWFAFVIQKRRDKTKPYRVFRRIGMSILKRNIRVMFLVFFFVRK